MYNNNIRQKIAPKPIGPVCEFFLMNSPLGDNITLKRALKPLGPLGEFLKELSFGGYTKHNVLPVKC